MHPLDWQIQRRNQEAREKLLKAQKEMTRITEESSFQGTNDFTSAALGVGSDRRSPRKKSNNTGVPQPDTPNHPNNLALER